MKLYLDTSVLNRIFDDQSQPRIYMDSIRTEGVKVIIERLGIAKTAFFCRETMSQPMDYLELKEKMFGEKTAREIYEEIKKNR